jgi:hypothetical protein
METESPKRSAGSSPLKEGAAASEQPELKFLGRFESI